MTTINTFLFLFFILQNSSSFDSLVSALGYAGSVLKGPANSALGYAGRFLKDHTKVDKNKHVRFLLSICTSVLLLEIPYNRKQIFVEEMLLCFSNMLEFDSPGRLTMVDPPVPPSLAPIHIKESNHADKYSVFIRFNVFANPFP